MKRTLLLCALAVLGVLSAAGTVAADEGPDVGVCVVGVESPCNGDSADNTSSGVDDGDVPVDSNDRSDDAVDDDPIQFHPDELPYASGVAGDDAPEVDRPGAPLDRLPALRALFGLFDGLF